MHTTQKLYALTVATLFIAMGFVAIVPEVEAQTTPTTTLQVTGPDYETVVTEVFGSASAHVVLNRPPSQVAHHREAVAATASVGGQTVSFDLLETGVRTGKFIGSFVMCRSGSPGCTLVTPAASPDTAANAAFPRIWGNARLPVPDANNQVTVTAGGQNVAIRWFVATNGHLDAFKTITRGSADRYGLSADPVDNQVLGWQSIIYFRITDPDLNRRSELDLYPDTARLDTHPAILRVWSDSDPVGNVVPVRQTAAGATVHTFDGEVGFESTFVPTSGRVFVREGDNIYASFTDLRDGNGVRRDRTVDSDQGPLIWRFGSASTATIHFGMPSHVGFTQVNPTGLDRAVLHVLDVDRDTTVKSENVVAKIFVNNIERCQVLLHQLGGVPGSYWATLGFTDGQAGRPDATCKPGSDASIHLATGAVLLDVAGVDQVSIRAVYVDAVDGSGATVNAERAATTRWIRGTDGVLTLGPDQQPPAMRLVGTFDPVNIRLLDPDANRNPNVRESLVVQVRSSSSPTGGIAVTLTERTEDSGDFVGSFQLTATGSSGGNTLRVSDGDFIIAFYEDPAGTAGIPVRILSQKVVWRQPTLATISTENPSYMFGFKRSGPVGSVEFLDTNLRPTTSRNAITTIVFDTTGDGTYDLTRVPHIQFQNDQGSPRQLCHDQRAQVMINVDPTNSTRRVVHPLQFRGDDDVPLLGCVMEGTPIWWGGPDDSASPFGTSFDPHNIAVFYIDLTQEGGTTVGGEVVIPPPNRATSPFFDFRVLRTGQPAELVTAGSNSVRGLEGNDHTLRLDPKGTNADDEPVGAINPVVRNRVAGFAAQLVNDGNAFGPNLGTNRFEEERASSIVLFTQSSCQSDRTHNAYLRFFLDEIAVGGVMRHEVQFADRVEIDFDGELGPEEPITIMAENPGDFRLRFFSAPFPGSSNGVRALALQQTARVLLSADGDIPAAGALAADAIRIEFLNETGALVPANHPTLSSIRVDLTHVQDQLQDQLPAGTPLVRTLPVREEPCTEARIFVTDPDQSDPRVRDHIFVQAETTVPPGQPSHSVTLRLDEVGTGTGVFTGVVRFTDQAIPSDGSPGHPSMLMLGPFGASKTSQNFRVEYVDVDTPSGSPATVRSAEIPIRKPINDRLLRIEEADGVGFSIRDLLVQPGRGSNCCNGQTYTLVMYGPIGLPQAERTVHMSSDRCAEIKSVVLHDSGPGGVIDGRYALSIDFRTMNLGDSCTAGAVSPAGRLGVAQSGTVVTFQGPPGVGSIQVTTKASAESSIQAFGPAGEQLGPGTPRVGTERPVRLESTSSNNNIFAGGRHIVTANAGSVTDDRFWEPASIGGPLFSAMQMKYGAATANRVLSGLSSGVTVELVSTEPSSNTFMGSFMLDEYIDPADPLEFSDSQGMILKVNSTLQGDWGLNPSGLRNLPKNFEGVTISGLGTTSFRWVSGEPAELSVQRFAAGSQAELEVVLRDMDVMNHRVSEIFTSDLGQRTFRTAQPFVPGSEVVVDDRRHTQAAGGSMTVTAGGQAAEAFIDRNVDGRWTCEDLVSISYQSGSCGSINPRTGVISHTGCPTGGCRLANHVYTYRLAHAAGETHFQYLRIGDDQIRLGAPIPDPNPEPGEDGDPNQLDLVFRIEYTPAHQEVMVISPTEVERVKVRWDETAKAYRGTIPVELVPTPNNGRIHVQNIATPLTVMFLDPTMPDGLPAPTDSRHFNAIMSRAEWRPGQTGSISFHSTDYTAVLSSRAFGPGIAVQVVDADASRTSSRDVIMLRAQQGGNAANFITIPLRETTPTSGVFRGIVPIGNGPGELNLPVPTPTNPTTLVVTYNDRFGANGLPVGVSSAIQWRPAGTANIELHKDSSRTIPVPSCGSGGCDVLRGGETPVFVRIADPDANRNPNVVETIQARVFSDSDPEGVLVTLIETATDSGVFVSTGVRFSSQDQPGSDRVFVREPVVVNGEKVYDRIQVVYDDPLNAEGRRQVARSTVFHWEPTHDGAVNIESTFYVGTTEDAAATPPKAGLRHIAFVTVSEGDCNRDPNRPDVIRADHPDADCRPENFAFSMHSLSRSTELIRPSILVETGANTGVFVAVFTFSTAGSTNDVPLPTVWVQHGDEIRAEYVDGTPADIALGSRTFTDSAGWFQHGFGVVRFDRPGYNSLTDVPRITLLDGNAGTGPITVTVSSQASGSTTLSVQLTQTTAGSGLFQGSITLTEGATGGGAIRVGLIDQLTVVYQDANPVGSRTHTAAIGIGQLEPPVTTLVLDPSEANGMRGVYVTRPMLAFTANEPVQSTFFRLNQVGSFVPINEPLQLLEGATLVEFFSIDLFGNEEEVKQQLVEVDLTPPGQVPTGLEARPAPGGAAQLNWTDVPNTLDPFEFFDYVVFRDGNLNTPIANTTTPGFLDTSLTDESPRTYQVAVRDKAGHLGPLTPAVSVTPDATPPQISAPSATPTTFDTRNNPGSIQASVTASDLNLDLVRAQLVAPGDNVLASAELAPTGQANRFGAGLDVSNVTEPCTCTLVFTALDVAGNAATASLDYVVTGPDTQPPSITFVNVPTSGQVVVGTAIQVSVTDNVGLSEVRYTLNGVNVTVPLAPPGASVLNFTVPTAGLALGEYTLSVLARDTAVNEQGDPTPNLATAARTFTLVEGDTGPPGTSPGLPASFFLATTATTRADGSIRVQWQVPQSLMATGAVAGFQVWRASSPFEEVHRSENPNQRSFVDTTTQEGTSYRYVATFYTDATGPFGSLAAVEGYPGSDDQVPASDSVTAGEARGLPGWLWAVLIALAVLAVAAVVAIAIASRRGAQQQTTVQEEAPPVAGAGAWDEPALDAEAEEGPLEETHRMKCPECQHRFEVTGAKPIVTNCPNCGRKGILR